MELLCQILLQWQICSPQDQGYRFRDQPKCYFQRRQKPLNGLFCDDFNDFVFDVHNTCPLSKLPWGQLILSDLKTAFFIAAISRIIRGRRRKDL